MGRRLRSISKPEELIRENLELKARLQEAERTLQAIREGDGGVDGGKGGQVSPELEAQVQARTAELLRSIEQLKAELARRAPVEEELRARSNQLARVASQLTIAAAEPKAIRVLVVDDHVIMRQGLARLLKAQPDMDVVGEAADGESAIRMARLFLPDVIVMDMSMPVMSGAEATRVIHSEMPDIRVIGLSMFEEEEKAELMKRAGAVRYLTKTGPSSNLIAAIRETARKAQTGTVAH